MVAFSFSPLAQVATMRPLTALTVDDNDAQGYAMSHMLERCGFKTEIAVSGRDALRMAEGKPDVILLDLHLPDFDGFQVCSFLRTNPNTSNIPVVMYSSISQGGPAVNRAHELGVSFLFLPVLPIELDSVIRGAMASHGHI